MKAMIFAAGLGTRLRPITNDIPKALAPLCDKTLLLSCIEYLAAADVDEIIINIHHYADKIIEYLKSNTPQGVRISFSDEREQLLDTGGGLKNVASFFKDDKNPFLLINVDVFTDTDLLDMLSFHEDNDALITLAVRKRTTSRYLLFDEKYSLVGWKNEKNNDIKWVKKGVKKYQQLAFSGIHVVSPDIFALMPSQKTFSIIDLYLQLAEKNNIIAYDHTNDMWMDLGKPEQLKEAERIIKNINQ